MFAAASASIAFLACSDLGAPPTRSDGDDAEHVLAGTLTSELAVRLDQGTFISPEWRQSVRLRTSRSDVRIEATSEPTTTSGPTAPDALIRQSTAGSLSEPGLGVRAVPSNPAGHTSARTVRKTVGGRVHAFAFVQDDDDKANRRPPKRIIHYADGVPIDVMHVRYRRVGNDWIVAGGMYAVLDSTGKQRVEVRFDMSDMQLAMGTRSLRQAADVLAYGIRSVLSPRPLYAAGLTADEIDEGLCAELFALSVQLTAQAVNMAGAVVQLTKDCFSIPPDIQACADIAQATVLAAQAASIAVQANIIYWNTCVANAPPPPPPPPTSGGGEESVGNDCWRIYEWWYDGNGVYHENTLDTWCN